MKQTGRIVIAFVLLLGILFLARNQVAWAGGLEAQNVEPVQNMAQSIVDPENAEPGTVKPPPEVIEITESGTYSIGGFCTITIELTSPDIRVKVYIERPLPRRLPDGVHAVRQGCRVTYYESGTRIDEFSPEQGSAQICFAALPKKEMKLYFHNVYSATPSWVPLDTTVTDGIACAAGNQSGIYVGTFTQNP